VKAVLQGELLEVAGSEGSIAGEAPGTQGISAGRGSMPGQKQFWAEVLCPSGGVVCKY
jgi:hypothetical protein